MPYETRKALKVMDPFHVVHLAAVGSARSTAVT